MAIKQRSNNMATSPQIVPPQGEKKRRSRSPSVAKPAYFVIEVLDETGKPVKMDKKRIKLVAVERDIEKAVMMCEEDGEHPNAVWLRGVVPVTRQSATRTTPQAA